MSLIKYQLKSLQKTCLDYITRPCREKGYTSWIERVSVTIAKLKNVIIV